MRPKLIASVLALFWMFTCLGILVLAQQEPSEHRKVVARVTPEYPPVARTMNITGTVRVEAVVAGSGSVKSADVKGGHPVLAEAALRAVKKWKWEPADHETHEVVELKFQPQGASY
jgi:TonB family protein